MTQIWNLVPNKWLIIFLTEVHIFHQSPHNFFFLGNED